MYRLVLSGVLVNIGLRLYATQPPGGLDDRAALFLTPIGERGHSGTVSYQVGATFALKGQAQLGLGAIAFDWRRGQTVWQRRQHFGRSFSAASTGDGQGKTLKYGSSRYAFGRLVIEELPRSA